jgi:hypothetical protein
METRTVRYVGSRDFADMFTAMLQAHGVEIEHEAPMISRSRAAENVATGVTIYYLCKGGDAAIKAALDQVRARTDRATAEIEDDDEED